MTDSSMLRMSYCDYIALPLKYYLQEINIYNVHIIFLYMVRRMKATITRIESVVTPSGNSGHVVVPKAWIGKEAIVTLKEKENKIKGKR
jgi:putative transposon-encoded protein